MLSYIGLGYTDHFTENFDGLCAELTSGASILVVSGLDDICQSLQGEIRCAHSAVCATERIHERDRLALEDVATLLGSDRVTIGQVLELTQADVTKLRECFARGTIRRACQTCQWFETCTGIAATNFAGTKLYPRSLT